MKTEWLKINQMVVSWNESEARMGYRAAEQVMRKNITDMRNVIKRVIQDCITRLFNQSPLSIYVDQMIKIHIWANASTIARIYIPSFGEYVLLIVVIYVHDYVQK